MASDEKPTSIWKKELSFKRKPEEAAASAKSPQADDKATPVWKKEISLRRKPRQAPALEAAAPDSVPAAPVEPASALVAEPLSIEPVASALEPEVDHSWLTQPLEEVSLSGEALVAEAQVAPEPGTSAADLPAPVLPLDPDPAPILEPALLPEPTLPLPLPAAAPLELPAELLEAAAALLAPAVESSPAEPAEETEAKVPFYKRDLSRGRSPKSRERSNPSQAEPAAQADAPGWDETDVAKPFFKRELSFGRGSKPEKAPKGEKAPKAERAPRVPRELPKLRRLSAPGPVAGGGKAAKRLVGLKIGASQIAAARIANGSTPELLQAAREPLAPGIVVGGELRDPEALVVALRDFFRKHGLPKRGVRLGIANNRIGVRTFDVVGIDDPKQLANAIRFRAQEVLPIPIEEAVLDYQILSEFTDAEGNLVRRVLLVVAYRELVDRYLLACRKAGIQIVGIDLEAFALLRAIAEPRDPDGTSEQGALVAVSVGHDRSTFAVSDGRTCEFTRVLEWGGWAMNVAIARALDLSPSEAEPIKRALSFAGPEVLPEGLDVDKLATAREAARRQVQSFARELVSSLQFYQNQPGSLGIGEIVLTGGTAHLPGFGSELERLIGVPVRVGDPLARLKVSKKLLEHEQTGSLAIAIGLGIED